MRLEDVMKILDLAIKIGDLHFFMTGLGVYNINAKNGYGVKEHDISLVMKAIYKRYETNPDMSTEFYDSLMYIYNTTKHGGIMLQSFKIIKHQLRAEKSGSAPFTIDCEKLLQAAKENIIRNREMYLRRFDDLPTGTHMGEFTYVDAELYKEYGYHIL